jgi:hypothetical protein
MRSSAPIERAPRWLWAVYLTLCSVALLVVLTFSFGRDQGIYGVVAERWRHGVWPYEGAWDFKPPGIFLVFLAIQSALGCGEEAVRVVEVAGLLGLLAGLFHYGRRTLRSESVGLVAGLLALVTHVQLDFWHTAQPETFAAPLLVGALLLTEAEGALATMALGFLGGFLFLIKPPLGAAAAMPLVVGLVRGRVSGARVALASAASLVPIAILVWAFHRAGALGVLRETLFVFAPGYTKLGWEGETALTLVYRTVERTVTGFSGPVFLGLLLRIAARRPWGRESELLAMLALCMLGTALQAKLFPYHFGAILPLASVLAAEGYVATVVEARVAGRLVVALTFAAVFVARGATRDVTGTFLERTATRLRALPAFLRGDRTALDALDKAADLDQTANRALAAWFAEASRPDERVFLFGFDPSVYLEAGRAPASRYLYDVPLRATWSAEHRVRLLRDLRAQVPVAIAIERYDRMKMVTGSDADSFEAAHAFPEFMAFLEEKYGKVDDLGRFERWVLVRTPKNEDFAPGSDTIAP